MLLILLIILCAPSFLRVLQHLLVFYYFLNSTSRLDNFFPNHLSIDKIMYCEAAVCCCICLSALSIVGEGNTQRSKINFKYFTGFCAVEVLLCWNLLCFVSFWRNFLLILKTVDVSLQKKNASRWEMNRSNIEIGAILYASLILSSSFLYSKRHYIWYVPEERSFSIRSMLCNLFLLFQKCTSVVKNIVLFFW